LDGSRPAFAWLLGIEPVAIGISTSGGSAHILSALAEARKRGLLTVGLAVYDGGRIVGERLADHAVVVRADYYRAYRRSRPPYTTP